MAQSVASEAKLIARHSAVYGLASVLDRVVSFIMLPVYTRLLTPADYGVLELLYLTNSVISLVIGMGLESAVSRFYFDYEKEEDRNKVVGTAVVGYGGMMIAISLFLMLFAAPMSGLVLESSDQANLLIVSLASLGIGMVLPVYFAYMRVRQKSFEYMITKVGMTVLTLGLNILFVVVYPYGVMGVLMATLLTNVVFLILLSITTLRKTGISVKWPLLRDMLKFGWPLIPSNIGAYIVQASDRYFVKEYVSVAMTGIYSLGYKIGTLVNQFVTSPFLQVWAPRRYELFNTEGYEKIYPRIFTYFCTLSLFVGLMISLLAREIIKVVAAESFWEAYKVVPVVVLAYIIFSFHHHFNIGILMKKATKYVAYVNVLNGVLNVILNMLLIKPYGIFGAAVATLLCFIFKAALTFYFSNRLYPIHMEWRRVGLLFVMAFIVFFAGIQVETGSLWMDVVAKTGIGCLFPLSLFAVKFFTEDELKRLKQIIKTRSLKFD
jgi:O-antigen/teichoic acid export membrane protein